MLSALAWHSLAAFIHSAAWQDIATVLEALVLAGALWLWFYAD